MVGIVSSMLVSGVCWRAVVLSLGAILLCAKHRHEIAKILSDLKWFGLCEASGAISISEGTQNIEKGYDIVQQTKKVMGESTKIEMGIERRNRKRERDNVRKEMLCREREREQEMVRMNFTVLYPLAKNLLQNTSERTHK